MARRMASATEPRARTWRAPAVARLVPPVARAEASARPARVEASAWPAPERRAKGEVAVRLQARGAKAAAPVARAERAVRVGRAAAGRAAQRPPMPAPIRATEAARSHSK